MQKKINKLKVICITGSSGKTTVKEWLTRILKNSFVVYSNPGNFNNYIGMPLTLDKYSKENRNMYFRIRYE